MPDIVFDRKVDRHFTSIDDLRALVPAASGPAAEKEIDHVDDLSARFIAAAPLAIMATRRASGQVDVTPRGDPPGFVRVLDRNTLALPDRPGNRRLGRDAGDPGNRRGQSVVLHSRPPPHPARHGRAAVVRDAGLASGMEVNGHPPELIVLLQVSRVMSHCPKAFIRGRIWQPGDWPADTDVPTLAEMLKAHAELAQPVEEYEAQLAERIDNTLY